MRVLGGWSPLFPIQVHGGVVVMDGVKEGSEDVGHFHAHGGRVHTGVAAEPFGVQHVFVDDQPDTVVSVVHEPHDADGAGLDVQELLHELRARKGQAGDAQLAGDLLGLELFVVLDHQEIEVCLLPVAQKQVLANDRRRQDLVDLCAHLHGLRRFRVDTIIFKAKPVQEVVDPEFLFQSPLFVSRPAAVNYVFQCSLILPKLVSGSLPEGFP